MNDELSNQKNEKDSMDDIKEKSIDRVKIIQWWLKNPVEKKPLEQKQYKKHMRRSCLMWIILVILLFILQMVIDHKHGISFTRDIQRIEKENECIYWLIIMGAAQHRYKEESSKNIFTTFETLQRERFLPPDLTKEHLIENYSISVFKISPTEMGCNEQPEIDSTFTIVAVPDTNVLGLRRFAIGTDQKLMFWKGNMLQWSKDDINLSDERLWEPLR